MPLATKENSVESRIPPEAAKAKSGDQPAAGRPRLALAAKSVNSITSDSPYTARPSGAAVASAPNSAVVNEWPQSGASERANSLKRAASHGHSFTDATEETKRFKVYSGAQDSLSETDDDETPPASFRSMEAVRNSTPYATKTSRHWSVDGPAPELDFPSTDKAGLSRILEEEDINDIDIHERRLAAPNYGTAFSLEEFLRNVEASLSIELNDLQDLDISEDSEIDPDASYLHLKIPGEETT